jgi:hypothetical protein
MEGFFIAFLTKHAAKGGKILLIRGRIKMSEQYTDVLVVQGIMEKGYGITPKIPMQDRRLTVEAKAIYSYICSFAGAGTTAFPSRAKMMYDLCMGEKRFDVHFKLLKDLKYISVEKRRGIRGRFERNIYTLLQTIEVPKLNISPYPQNDGMVKSNKLPYRQNRCMDNRCVDNRGNENEGSIINSEKINITTINTQTTPPPTPQGEREDVVVSECGVSSLEITDGFPEKKIKTSLAADETPYNEILARFREICPHHILYSDIKTDKPLCKAIKRLFEKHGMDGFIKLFETVAGNDFLCGGGAGGWKPDFKWFMKPGKFEEVINGKYCDRKSDLNQPDPAKIAAARKITPTQKKNRFCNYESNQDPNHFGDIAKYEQLLQIREHSPAMFTEKLRLEFEELRKKHKLGDFDVAGEIAAAS